jgi:hypothetical protein
MNSELHRMLPNFVAVGTWIPILGTFVGILGRPKIAFATILASAGTILFWFGTTLP